MILDIIGFFCSLAFWHWGPGLCGSFSEHSGGLLPGVHPASAISRHWIGGQRSPNHQSLEESAVAAVNASTEAFLAHDDQRSYPRKVFDLSVVFNYVALTAGEGRLLSLFHEVE